MYLTIPFGFTDPLGYGPDDTYVFVNGCSGSGSVGCDPSKETSWDALAAQWAGYLALLKAEYLYQKWGPKELLYVWLRSHVRFLTVQSASSGADRLQQLLSEIPGNGGIHLIGHSLGAAAIMEYLARARESEVAQSNPAFATGFSVTLDPRIRSAVMIDPAMGWMWQVSMIPTARCWLP